MPCARTALLTATLLAAPGLALADPDLDALRTELAKQQAQIAAQQQQIDALAAAKDSASPGSGDTTVGGYGEMHFNDYRTAEDPNVGKSNIHLHRAVILLGHRFSDDLHFFSEVEFEGAPDSSVIETEVEQFGIAWQVRNDTTLTLGQFLLPVGLLNESHEPDVFYGVERNPVEERIIPATWWEKGVMAGVDVNDRLHVDVAVHDGLRGDINTLGSADGLREFRQEFGGAHTSDPAYTLRVKYVPVPALQLAASVQRQDNITQGNDPLTGGRAPALLWEAHAVWTTGRFSVRTLATAWNIDNDLAASQGTDRLRGWYVEPSWKLSETVGLFTRYNRWNTAAHTGATDSEQTNVGVNWWLHPRVVLKADLQDTNQPNHAGDGFNLGFGLSF